jgi:hypothetical protein
VFTSFIYKLPPFRRSSEKNIVDIPGGRPDLFNEFPSRYTLSGIFVGYEGKELRQVDRPEVIPSREMGDFMTTGNLIPHQ